MAVKAYPDWVSNYGGTDWGDGTKTYYCMLIKTGSYNAVHVTVADATLTEITAGGYAKQNVTSRTKAVSGANVNLDGNDVAFGNLANNGESIIAVVLVRQLGGAPATTDRLAGFYDGGASPNNLPFTLNGGPFDVIWPAAGAIQYQT